MRPSFSAFRADSEYIRWTARGRRRRGEPSIEVELPSRTSPLIGSSHVVPMTWTARPYAPRPRHARLGERVCLRPGRLAGRADREVHELLVTGGAMPVHFARRHLHDIPR